ncbi:hypothetical protein BC749_1179 [Flavobacterium araucananum]|uniref:hypothetical protein n=1 Tax=Flavobacterium araucananum TaxID=946678 RepID=UPI000D6BAC6F|nr:hypothetical protein [Flavobacterium araucananum]PWJ92214.1 hypothetical protein BC749_1179 [Flavobacterium araucananum]
MDKENLEKLQDSLRFLESKQRDLKLYSRVDNDVRAFDSFIRYLKRDIIIVFNLDRYDSEIIYKINDTDFFIENVQHIIKLLKLK